MDKTLTIEIFKMVRHGTRERITKEMRCHGKMYQYVKKLSATESMMDEHVKKYSGLIYLDIGHNMNITAQ